MVLISDNILFDISVLLIIAVPTFFYLYFKHAYLYWDRRGVDYLQPTMPFGNMKNTILGRENYVDEFERIYNEISGPFGGIFSLATPSLVVKDPDLIKHIMIKDFNAFMDRGMYVNEEKYPLTCHLFSMKGDQWKIMRNKLSPTFTSEKLKHMIQHFVKIGQRLQDHLETLATSSDTKFEACDLISRYTVENITSIAFGVETDCFNNSNEPFLKYGKLLVEPDGKGLMRQMFFELAPKLAEFLNVRVFDEDLEQFFRDVTIQTLKMREQQKVERNDFMQLLVQLRNQGFINVDGKLKTEIVNSKSHLVYVYM